MARNASLQDRVVSEGLKGIFTGIGTVAAGLSDGITRTVSDNNLVIAGGAVAMGLAASVAADMDPIKGTMLSEPLRYAGYGHQGAGYDLFVNEIGITSTLQSDQLVNVNEVTSSDASSSAEKANPVQQY